jgi:hypothetical protein
MRFLAALKRTLGAEEKQTSEWTHRANAAGNEALSARGMHSWQSQRTQLTCKGEIEECVDALRPKRALQNVPRLVVLRKPGATKEAHQRVNEVAACANGDQISYSAGQIGSTVSYCTLGLKPSIMPTMNGSIIPCGARRYLELERSFLFPLFSFTGRREALRSHTSFLYLTRVSRTPQKHIPFLFSRPPQAALLSLAFYCASRTPAWKSQSFLLSKPVCRKTPRSRTSSKIIFFFTKKKILYFFIQH